MKVRKNNHSKKKINKYKIRGRCPQSWKIRLKHCLRNILKLKNMFDEKNCLQSDQGSR